MPTPAQVFGEAWRFHQAGSLAQAEQLYRQVLQADPRHADAWCFLGAVCQAQGRIADAQGHLQRALQILPSHPSAGNLLGVILAQQGKFDEAAKCFHELLRHQPADAGAWNNLGLARLQQGRLEEAASHFRQALAYQPNHADAYANMGAALLHLGRVDEAITCFERALRIKPDFKAARDYLNRAQQHQGFAPRPAQPAPLTPAGTGTPQAQPTYQSAMTFAKQGQLAQAVALFQQALAIQSDYFDAIHNLGTCLFMQGHFEEAVDRYRQALCIRPDNAGAHYNLGLGLQQVNRKDEALASYQQALALEPNHLDARNNVGNMLKDQGKFEEAIACYQYVLQLKPDFAEVHSNLGIALAGQGKWDEAMARYHHAIRLKPTYPDAHNSLAIVLLELDRLEEAVASCKEALRLNPSFPEAHNTLGNILEKQGKFDDAVSSYRQAIRFKPKMAEAFNNQGNALKRQGKLDEAVQSYQEAVHLKPDYAEAHGNLGNTRVQQARFEEAQTCYDVALRLDANHKETHFNQSLLWLLLGKWAAGWPEYEWRWQTKSFPRYAFSQPRWNGSESGGPRAVRRILVLAEQGLGDTLQFIRYVRLVKERGHQLILQCQPALMLLLSGAAGIDQLVAQGTPLPEFDAYVPLLSLPAIFGTAVDSLQSAVPYLQVEQRLVEQWRYKLNGAGSVSDGRGDTKSVAYASGSDSFRVGIAWQGNPIFRVDWQRSIPLRYFARLAEIKGVKLISLQKGPGTEQLRASEGKLPVVDLAGDLDAASGPFMDTAAVMRNLDLVISSDTAVPHLAGALGVPVWVALPVVPDWRWLLEREDSPWYPSMRLFRQTRLGQWDDVFDRITEELKRVVRGP